MTDENDDLDLASRLTPDVRAELEFGLKCFSPDDSKYYPKVRELADFLTPEAEWRAFAEVQRVLLETRVEFGQAKQSHVDEVAAALGKISPLNMALLEEHVTKHDQLAVLEEIGRHVSPETKAMLHPGTTSYDVVDTARAYLLNRAWKEVMRPKVCEAITKLCAIAEGTIDYMQVGRTHLQDTSPVSFGGQIAGYAARLAGRVAVCDRAFQNLRGKVSGIVGTGASIQMVIGKKSLLFEERVLEKLGLRPDYTATQVTQKERYVDVGHGISTLMAVLGDFAHDVRLMYSSAIREVTSRDNKARLGGSSADATKNNPIEWENIEGKVPVVLAHMQVLYAMVQSDFERDLRSSVQARYSPGPMIAEVYESFKRASKALDQFSVNEDRLRDNLLSVRANPSEAMVAILRGEAWVHYAYGVGHDFVKHVGKKAQKEGRMLLEVAMEDQQFHELYDRLPDHKQRILRGELELYLGHSKELAAKNILFARNVMSITY